MADEFKIAGITPARLANSAHYTFMEAALVQLNSFVKPKAQSGGAKKSKKDLSLERLRALVSDMEAALKAEDKVFSTTRKSEKTPGIAAADKKSGECYSIYRGAVKAFVGLPEGQKSSAAKRLKENMDLYNLDTAAPLDKETGVITNMMQDLDTSLKADVKTLGLSEIVSEMAAANETVKNLMDERDLEKSKAREYALRDARAAVDEAYLAVREYINARSTLEGPGDFAPLIALLNTLTARIRKSKGKGRARKAAKPKKMESPAETPVEANP